MFNGLIVLENISSHEFDAGALPNCPLCSAKLRSTFWLRAGLDAFVTAALCLNCNYLIRANDALSLSLPEGDGDSAVPHFLHQL